MWANDLQKKQSVCKEYYKPRPCLPGWHDRGINRPAPPNRPGANPVPINRGPTNPPQSRQTPPIDPANGPPQLHQPRPINPGPIARANQPRQTNRGQTPPKQSPNRWGPINPQTGQTINPIQPPANPKQPRKRPFEVSAHLLSKAKKTPD
jgi:hypothetical protein